MGEEGLLAPLAPLVEVLGEEGVHVLAHQDQPCTSTRVRATTSGLGAQLGQVSSVTVTISCTVPLGDLLLLGGGPGVRTVSSSFTSIVDAYRGRG